MAALEEKVAYLKGLCEGMDIDTEKGEGKLLAKIIEVLGEITDEIACMEEDYDELQAQVDEIDEDLGYVEEDLYGDDDDDDDCDCDCGCCDFDCEDIKCPNCGEEIYLDSDVLDLEDDNLICPACGHEIELECDCFDDDFEDEE